MKITLMNYDGEKASVDIGNKEDIDNIFIAIISGDEVAHITYKDYSHKSYDSAQGEWVEEEEYGDLWVCDQCGFANEYKFNFCPNCGAKMKGGAE